MIFSYTYRMNAVPIFLNYDWIDDKSPLIQFMAWWRHQMETFSALLAICAGNSPVPGEFPTQRPVTRSFDVCFDLRPDKRLSKQSWGWWFETLSRPFWRHSNGWCRTGNKPLPDAMLTKVLVAIWRHQTTISYVVFTTKTSELCVFPHVVWLYWW